MEIKTLDDMTPRRVFGLLAGKAGVGKTTQMTTFPKEETLGISVEDGFLSIAGSGFAFGECESYEEIVAEIKEFRDKNPWVKYLFIDSLTEIYDVLKSQLKKKYTAKQNYAKNDEIVDCMLHVIRLTRKLGIDVFFTCHTKWEKNGVVTEQDLAFEGKLPEAVKKQFDVCIHLDKVLNEETGKEERVFITNPDISKAAKARVSPWLGTEINDYEEPNLYELVKKLKGEK